MIRVFYGGNRTAAEQAIRRTLGEDYEVIDGGNLELADLPSVFQGTTLFEGEERRVLLKNVSENVTVWEKIADYLNTEVEAVIWEMKLDKRTTGYKRLLEAKVEMREFPEVAAPESKLVFGILDLALRDGSAAVREVEKIELLQDPYMFLGLLVTQALKKYEQSGGGTKERRLLKKLAELDMQMKEAVIEPWTLVKGFLLTVKKG